MLQRHAARYDLNVELSFYVVFQLLLRSCLAASHCQGSSLLFCFYPAHLSTVLDGCCMSVSMKQEASK